MSETVISAQRVQKIYSDAGSDVEVLKHVDLEVAKGERLAIIGSSGAGKSTLLNVLGGLDTPTSGTVHVAGQRLDQLDDIHRSQLRNRHLGFVYQFHHLLGEFTALENVAMPLLIAGEKRELAEKRALDVLQQTGLADRIQHKPAELSGGERQRVAIARAIVMRPACVLMDEPTGNLDEQTAAKIESLLVALNQSIGLSFILVTHDKRLAFNMDRVLELRAGTLLPVAMETTDAG